MEFCRSAEGRASQWKSWWLGGSCFSPGFFSRNGLILNAERALVGNMGLCYIVEAFESRTSY